MHSNIYCTILNNMQIFLFLLLSLSHFLFLPFLWFLQTVSLFNQRASFCVLTPALGEVLAAWDPPAVFDWGRVWLCPLGWRLKAATILVVLALSLGMSCMQPLDVLLQVEIAFISGAVKIVCACWQLGLRDRLRLAHAGLKGVNSFYLFLRLFCLFPSCFVILLVSYPWTC